ncbi:hypothetical protein DdX_00130 [Ditylenchus destructor]|uniref:Uncharacterized protein n=1 Tax=Ditylenchus destructor TaxID=166010 RepID=A0AAD4NGF1_9BILA|nr:hypothetical protein DdX_00130 [Ditylenchus destructor]
MHNSRKTTYFPGMTFAEIKDKLRIQLVTTIGPMGSKRGCWLTLAMKHFQRDWDEKLEDYADFLGYRCIVDMLRDMKDDIRVELDTKIGRVRIYPVATPELAHCFFLIDRTKPKSRTEN